MVFKGKRMKLTDEATYEMVHSNLDALELSDETGDTMIGCNAVILNSIKEPKRHSNLKQTTAQ